MKNMYFIVNPYSGKLKIKNALLDVIKIFNEGGYNVTVQTTMYQGHAIELVAGLDENTDIIVVSGGDGTLNEVLTGLLKSQKKLPVGYIPTGSTNDFAATFGIPTDPKIAAKQIVNGTGADIDIGRFGNDRYFSYIASFGIFTAASYNTPQNVKNTFGHMAYVLEGMKDLTKVTPHHVRIETDDGAFEGDYLFGSVTNTTSVGGIVKFDKDLVKVNDGLFEIVLVKNPANVNDLSKIIVGCTNSNFSDPVFEFIKTKRVRMIFENEMDWSVDGEHQKSANEVVIENIKCAATIIR